MIIWAILVLKNHMLPCTSTTTGLTCTRTSWKPIFLLVLTACMTRAAQVSLLVHCTPYKLPIPDACGDSIVIDFVGPCPWDDRFDCIVTITDHLGSDICIALTHTDISTERFNFCNAIFQLWYCENSLPLDIVSDRNKLFVSKFWKVLTKLTGIQ